MGKGVGTLARQALDEPVFAALDLPRVLDALAKTIRPARPATRSCAPTCRRPARPSVEATLHAGLPQRFVFHVHCVETISHAILVDGPARFAPLLDGLNWAWVPYIRPGLPLFRTIAPGADIYVLQNHGLVVAADTLDAAVGLIETVGRRLARPVQTAPSESRRRVERAGYHFVDAPALASHAVRLAAAGTYYPDHLVFLGSGAAVIDNVVVRRR